MREKKLSMPTLDLSKLNACEEGINWFEAKSGSLEEKYNACSRGDWLLWLAGILYIDRKMIVMAACDCAEAVLKYVPEGEDRPRLAIETARAWCRGEATIGEVKKAADAAAAAADDAAYAAAAADYPDCAADAADAAYAAAAAAYVSDPDCAADVATTAATATAADDVYASAYVSDPDAALIARRESLKKSADLVRNRIPFSEFERAITAAEGRS